ncbi:MAG: NAD(+) synthase [Ilumatobacteraceae bacterium]
MTSGSLEARVAWLTDVVRHQLLRRGGVVQTSGGIDSAVTLMLTARALGPDNTIALFLPDSATDPTTTRYAELVARAAQVELTEHSIAASIEAQQPVGEIHAIVAGYFPEFDPIRDAYSVTMSHDATRRLGTPVYELSVGRRHEEATQHARVRAADLRRVIAYQNRKQRTRMTCAYAEAEARGYAVVGASNGDELDTGFVVKYGDDAADVCAIADLTKPEVYALAREIGVPQELVDREPTTDTFALKQSQHDYYYSLAPDAIRDLVANTASAEEIASHYPGWTPSALRQLRSAYTGTVRYNMHRSVRYRPADPSNRMDS